MYGDCNINIERTQNGYLVRMTDPKLVEQNNKRDKRRLLLHPGRILR
jgi:hypothetical protein